MTQVINPNDIPNHKVANRMIKVAKVALVEDMPSNNASIPAIEASAAPIPPGKVDTAAMTVEKARMNTALEKVLISAGKPRTVSK